MTTSLQLSDFVDPQARKRKKIITTGPGSVRAPDRKLLSPQSSGKNATVCLLFWGGGRRRRRLIYFMAAHVKTARPIPKMFACHCLKSARFGPVGGLRERCLQVRPWQRIFCHLCHPPPPPSSLFSSPPSPFSYTSTLFHRERRFFGTHIGGAADLAVRRARSAQIGMPLVQARVESAPRTNKAFSRTSLKFVYEFSRLTSEVR